MMSSLLIPDANLRLALVQSMIGEGLVPQPDWTAVRQANPYDPDTDDYDHLDPSAEDYAEGFQEACGHDHVNDGVFDALDDLLDAARAVWRLLTTLHWSGDAEVIQACQPMWDGEDDKFDLTSLEGIGQFPGIRTVNTVSMFSVRDLEPLTGLPVLESIEIDYASEDTDWAALLRIPTLRRVRAPVDAVVAEQLATRGVDVQSRHWRHPLETLCPYEDLRSLAGRLLDMSVAERGDWVRVHGRDGAARKVRAAEETVLARAWLMLADPANHIVRGEFAEALLHLSGRLDRANHRQADAAAATGQAVEIFQELAGSEPDRYLPRLGAALEQLATRRDRHDVDNRIITIRDAITVYQILAHSNPARCSTTLVGVSRRLVTELTRLHDDRRAAQAALQHAELLRTRTATDPACASDLAATLTAVAEHLDKIHPRACDDPADHTHRRSQALSARKEAVALRRILAAEPSQVDQDAGGQPGGGAAQPL
jgi:hypothetical protein